MLNEKGNRLVERSFQYECRQLENGSRHVPQSGRGWKHITESIEGTRAVGEDENTWAAPNRQSYRGGPLSA